MGTNTKNPLFVIDSSVVISYLMVDEKIKPEHHKAIDQHLNHNATLNAPLLLPFEVGNSLRSAVLSKRINSTIAIELLSQLQALEINLIPLSHPTILSFAITHNLSFYDASYLVLAKQLKAPLLTLDKKLLVLSKSL